MDGQQKIATYERVMQEIDANEITIFKDRDIN